MIMQDIIGGIIQEHFDIESGLRAIAVFSEDRDNELRIIEVNENALPTGQVEPFVFAPQEKAMIPIYIADVTPDEWEAICNGQILLPDGWPKHPIRLIQRDVKNEVFAGTSLS